MSQTLENTSHEYTPLYIAARCGKTGDVKKILKVAKENGIIREVLTSKDSYGNTPLHVAANFGHTEVVKLILQVAKENGSLETVLTAEDNFGDTPLHEAIISGYAELSWNGWVVNVEIVKLLLQAAKDNGILKEVVTAKNSDGYTARGEAQFWGYKKKEKEILKFERLI